MRCEVWNERLLCWRLADWARVVAGRANAALRSAEGMRATIAVKCSRGCRDCVRLGGACLGGSKVNVGLFVLLGWSGDGGARLVSFETSGKLAEAL